MSNVWIDGVLVGRISAEKAAELRRWLAKEGEADDKIDVQPAPDWTQP